MTPDDRRGTIWYAVFVLALLLIVGLVFLWVPQQ